MIRSESAKTSIGIKILLYDLILQIKEMLNDGFIEDENDNFNVELKQIIYNANQKNDFNYLDFKEYLTNECKKSITYAVCMLTTTDDSNLFDKVFLLPIKEILTTRRLGYYDSEGTNSISRIIDFDLSINLDKYKEIKNIEIVFILAHHSI